MAELGRLKREMLREVVRENLDVIEGRLPRALRRRRRTLWTALLLALPLALVVAVALPISRRSQVLVVADPLPAEVSRPASLMLPAPHGLAPTLFRLAVTSVVLDPGHGGVDPGARTSSGLTEKEITLDVAERLKTLLQEARLRVAMTREKDDTLSLRERILIANASKADLFVSIHVNSIPMREKRAVETFVLGPTDDPHVARLAGEENRNSGYSLADFKKLLEGVYVGVRQTESRAFAEAVQRDLFRTLAATNPSLENRGVRTAPFAVLVNTEMPGLLAEVSCLSNEAEARRLGDPGYRQAIARALADGILAYAESRNHPPAQKGS